MEPDFNRRLDKLEQRLDELDEDREQLKTAVLELTYGIETATNASVRTAEQLDEAIKSLKKQHSITWAILGVLIVAMGPETAFHIVKILMGNPL